IEGDPEAHLLHTTLARKLGEVAGITPEQRTKYLAAAEKHIREGVYPSFQRAIQVLKSQVPKATDEAGLSRLPNGKEAYEFYLRRNTKGTATAEEIHGLGLREVARIEGEMDVLLRKLGYNDGSVKDRMQKLSDDTAYADEPNVRERILKDYNKIIQEATARLSSAFDLRPKASVIVQRIPEFQERNAAANYQSPPADGSRPGIFRVPLPGPKFYTAGMRTLAYHEAVPGHHFQIALGVETAGLPKFRRSSVFNPLSANAEGWALYAERLVSDLGWYKDDLKSDLGRLNAELFRARRLVVDTGLHAKRWTRQQGIDYGISESEVERYVVMPGQACSYKFGQLHILELREKARKALGGKFELKNFHNVVLREGLVPLDVLTRVVEDYIAGSAGPVAAN
ncbi:MAG TPA: DUF885 domain-containing protein, partial [Bryobacteraceae bacterium]|nr:DUF885 domain-containing protein [Bryobacteraceae bacterium]